jgi:hypothetical protein
MDPATDPWGIRRAENLLTSLEGVLSARVVTTPLGEVSEIHILATNAQTPKQVVRNVESALLAHLGLRVDHRKISVAHTAEVQPLKTLEQTAVDIARNRMETVARAAVRVIERLLEKHALALEGVQLTEAFGRSWVMVGVAAVGGRASTLLVGMAEVRESPEHATVFAVLDATNRWVSARRQL